MLIVSFLILTVRPQPVPSAPPSAGGATAVTRDRHLDLGVQFRYGDRPLSWWFDLATQSWRLSRLDPASSCFLFALPESDTTTTTMAVSLPRLDPRLSVNPRGAVTPTHVCGEGISGRSVAPTGPATGGVSAVHFPPTHQRSSATPSLPRLALSSFL